MIFQFMAKVKHYDHSPKQVDIYIADDVGIRSNTAE